MVAAFVAALLLSAAGSRADDAVHSGTDDAAMHGLFTRVAFHF
jgi:hypothetical protein